MAFSWLTSAWAPPLRATFALAAWLPACSAPETTDSQAAKATVVNDGCEAPSLALPDGSCIRPGIPPDGCGEGFQHDGEYGCDPILPEDDCAAGTMAIPGEAACRPVMPCGQGRWGDLPVDDASQYVDASYAGGGSDGSRDKPWATIGEAYEAADAGVLIAIAAGRYTETLSLNLKPIQIWGVCPRKVSVEGVSPGGTIFLGPGTDGSTVGGLAITNASFGLGIAGAQDITVDRVWIHQTSRTGIVVVNQLGPTSVEVRGSLIEYARHFGLYASGSEVSLISSVVRDTHTDLAQEHSSGIWAQIDCVSADCNPASRSLLTIESAVIERNTEAGISVLASDVTMTASLVRGTRPEPADQTLGMGVVLGPFCNTDGRCISQQGSRGTIASSLVADNHSAGIYSSDSELTLDDTVVRDTKPEAGNLEGGAGVVLQTSCDSTSCAPDAGSLGLLRSSLVANNHAAAFVVTGSTATIDSIVARRTLPQLSDSRLGTGILASPSCDEFQNCNPSDGSHITVSGSLVEDSYYAGIFAIHSEAQLSSSVIRRTKPRRDTDEFGDGLVLTYLDSKRTSSVDALRIEDSARAGIASFGVTLNISSTDIACAAFDLVGQDLTGWPHRFLNEGDNRCGCPTPTNACKATSARLDPPELLP